MNEETAKLLSKANEINAKIGFAQTANSLGLDNADIGPLNSVETFAWSTDAPITAYWQDTALTDAAKAAQKAATTPYQENSIHLADAPPTTPPATATPTANVHLTPNRIATPTR